MSAICITVDGILRKVVGNSPIPMGVNLYLGLASRFTIVLLTDERVGEGLSNWLDIEGLREHANVIYSDVVMDDYPQPYRRLQQVYTARHSSYDVELVLDPNPEVCAELITSGFNAATVTHAKYSMPEWRPDFREEVTPWATLSEQVARQAELRAEDARTGS